eukprot:scaffold20433_cov31-Tisochrysis_lutea.AAC.2
MRHNPCTFPGPDSTNQLPRTRSSRLGASSAHWPGPCRDVAGPPAALQTLLHHAIARAMLGGDGAAIASRSPLQGARLLCRRSAIQPTVRHRPCARRQPTLER